MVKRIGKWVGGVVLVGAVLLGMFVGYQVHGFNASMDRVYDLPQPAIARSTDPAVIARGKHVVDALAGCTNKDCHGADLGGTRGFDMGPIGHISCPNISLIAQGYSDGELARLLRYGVKKDGHGLLFMPFSDSSWMPDSDVQAVISWVRSMPPVDRANGVTHITPLGRMLDQLGKVEIDVTRRRHDDDWAHIPAPAPTAQYGAYLARSCMGCHGEHLSGGPIPGTPPSFPAPLNLTPDETGMKGYSYDDFMSVIRTATRKNGRKLDPFMPVEQLRQLDDTESHALWAYLSSLEPRKLGGR